MLVVCGFESATRIHAVRRSARSQEIAKASDVALGGQRERPPSLVKVTHAARRTRCAYTPKLRELKRQPELDHVHVQASFEDVASLGDARRESSKDPAAAYKNMQTTGEARWCFSSLRERMVGCQTGAPLID